MTNPRDNDNEPWTPAFAKRLDAIRDRFETAWRDGQRPRVEEHLHNVTEPARAELPRELLAIDLAYRRRTGDTISAEDYHQRLPRDSDAIAEVFHEYVQRATPSSGNGATETRIALEAIQVVRFAHANN